MNTLQTLLNVYGDKLEQLQAAFWSGEESIINARNWSAKTLALFLVADGSVLECREFWRDLGTANLENTKAEWADRFHLDDIVAEVKECLWIDDFVMDRYATIEQAFHWPDPAVQAGISRLAAALCGTVAATAGMNKANNGLIRTATRPGDDVKSSSAVMENFMNNESLVPVAKIQHAKLADTFVGYAAVGFTAMMRDGTAVACNRNLTANFDVGPWVNYRAQQAEPDFNPEGVNATGFGFCGEGLDFDASPIGAIAAQFKTGRGRAGYKPAVIATFELPSMPRACSVQWRYCSLLNGKRDDRERGDGVGLGVEMNRTALREAIMQGQSLELNGNVVEAYRPLVDILNEPGRYGARHFFVALCRVSQQDDRTKDRSRQVRLFCDEVTIFWVAPENLDAVFPDTRMFGFDLNGISRQVATKAPAPVVDVPARPAPRQPAATPQASVAIAEPVAVAEPIVMPPLTRQSSQELERYLDALCCPGHDQPRRKADVTVDQIKALLNGMIHQGHATAGVLAAHSIGLYCGAHGADLTHVGRFRWELIDIQNVVELVQWSLGQKSGWKKAGVPEQTIRMTQTKQGWKLSFDNLSYSFTFDGTFWYDHRGRAFMNTVEIVQEVVREKVNGRMKEVVKVKDLYVVSSTSNLMRALWLGLAPMLAQQKGREYQERQGANLIEFLGKAASHFRFTKDEVLAESGGFLHALECQYAPVAVAPMSPLVEGKFPDLKGDWAYALCRYYDAQEKRAEERDDVATDIDPDTLVNAIPLAVERYGMELVFHKGTFLRGDLSHIDMAFLRKTAPTYWAEMQERYGFDAATVVSLTTKAMKGAKRMLLGLAKAAEPMVPAQNGWRFPRQRQVGQGTAVAMAFMPTVVGPAGELVWVGPDETMPTALVDKRVKWSTSLEGNAEASGLVTVAGAAPDHYGFVYQPFGEWHYLKPTGQDCVVSCGDTVAFYHGPEGKTPIVLEYPISGALIGIRWIVRDGLVGRQVDIEYMVESQESWMKARSIVLKGMMVGGPADFIRNGMNQLDGVAIDCVALQDSIKSDTIYGWVTVAANTIWHNRQNPEMAEMLQEVYGINREQGVDGDLLVVDPVLVALGRYERLVDLFRQKFARPMWVNWSPAGSLGAMMLELYRNKSAAQVDGWHSVDAPVAERFSTVEAYADGKGEDANVLIFCLDQNGEVAQYWQRGMAIAGTAGCPVVDVLAFESSTVAEAVTTSVQLASYVRSLVRNQPKLMEEGKAMLLEGRDSALKASMLAAFRCCDTFGGTAEGMTVLPVMGDLSEVVELLEAEGVYPDALDLLDKDLFRKACWALRNVVFTFESSRGPTSVWMPGLYCFSSLRSTANGSLNMSGLFWTGVLIPLLQGRTIGSSVLNQVRGKIESLAESRGTAKLMTGRPMDSAKRVALPSIPSGETWVLRSGLVSSMWQTLDRATRSKLEAGEVVAVQGIRAPMADGMVTNLRVVTERDLMATGWTFGPHHLGVSPSDVYWDGGDCDGDGHNSIRIDDPAVKINGYQDVLDFRAKVLGHSMLAEDSESYAGDHLGIKSWASAGATLTNLKGLIGSKAAMKRQEFCSINAGARTIQTKGVGGSYEIFMLAEGLIDVVDAMAKAHVLVPDLFKPLIGKGDVITNLGEIYEVILGGYSPKALEMFKNYLSKVKEGTLCIESAEVFGKALQSLGINPQDAVCIAQCFHLVSEIKTIETIGSLNGARKPIENFCFAAALCGFELERGRFAGFNGNLKYGTGNKANGHRAAIALVATEVWEQNEEWVNSSLVLWNLRNVLRDCSSILVEGQESAMEFDALIPFVKACAPKAAPEQDEKSEDDQDGGGGSVPTPLSPQPNPVAPAAVETTMEVEQPVKLEELVSRIPADRMAEAIEYLESLVPKAVEPVVAAAVMTDWVEPVAAAAPAKEPVVEIAATTPAALPKGLTAGQAAAYQDAVSGHQCFITGVAGSGKSFVTQMLRSELASLGYKVIVLGSTGVSVMNVEGDGTFNSRLGLGLGLDRSGRGEVTVGEDYNSLVNTSVQDANVRSTFMPQKNKGVVVFIDEVSMLDATLIRAGYDIIKQINPEAVVHLVGDLLQLPPVGGEMMFKDSTLNFPGGHNQALESILSAGEFKLHYLTESRRVTGDVGFVDNLNALREGEGLGSVVMERFRASQEFQPDDALHVYFNNVDVQRHNNEMIERMIAAGAQSRTYNAKIRVFSGTEERLLNYMNPIPKDLTLCVGAPILIRKNLTEFGQLLAANGSRGIVIELGSDWVRVELDHGGTLKVKMMELDTPKNAKGNQTARFEQLPMQLAFASTGHTVQGLTLDTPLVVHAWQRRGSRLQSITSAGWMYVVCSRVTCRDLLFFDTEVPSAINMLLGSAHTDRDAVEFYSALSGRGLEMLNCGVNTVSQDGVPVKCCVAGSRGFNNYETLCKVLDEFLQSVAPDKITIVSGGARGADKLGERYATERGLKLEVYPADWNTLGKRAGYMRNSQMADVSTHLVAFWDGTSPGTAHMIKEAQSKGLTVKVEQAS